MTKAEQAEFLISSMAVLQQERPKSPEHNIVMGMAYGLAIALHDHDIADECLMHMSRTFGKVTHKGPSAFYEETRTMMDDLIKGLES